MWVELWTSWTLVTKYEMRLGKRLYVIFSKYIYGISTWQQWLHYFNNTLTSAIVQHLAQSHNALFQPQCPFRKSCGDSLKNSKLWDCLFFWQRKMTWWDSSDVHRFEHWHLIKTPARIAVVTSCWFWLTSCQSKSVENISKAYHPQVLMSNQGSSAIEGSIWNWADYSS